MDKKTQIIKTAMKLFVEQGFENTPTAQISKESEVATGTLFYHFKTKEELINEIYLFVKKDMIGSLFNEIKEGLDFKEQIKYLWINMITWGFKNKCENKFLTRFYGSTYINNLTVEQVRFDFEKTKVIFEGAIKEGLFKEMSEELFEAVTMGLFQSFLSEFYRINKLDENLLDLSFRIFWDAIAVK